ncbi:TetR/AcrR family transcriptional regulator [Amycolatopsis jiangsuensis]|uniref:AcrR family transcriptional regulator n=1 Tax=Amycolatopsis jiangsuensis TaxID=1181879 RepID=A0A840ITE7_9PSEU|nr:TetR family transcriptional regulator C-terminal domain-containing protein [Amycolatopsis jiangsuensis]MBB4684254.1 AcrR family transcriptional regulator [Amycolatopsis jiangsuensis]
MVDGEQRRAHIADAVLRLAARDGLHAVSLRTVAAEAQLNIGSVRHYFESQHDLMRFAMRATIDRASARLLRHREEIAPLADCPRDEVAGRLTELFAELLPLDELRRTEMTVLVEFLMAARAVPGLSDLAAEVSRGTVTLSRRILEALAGTGAFVARDPDVEAPRLAALLDGLAFRAVLQPEITTGEECLAVLRAHLAELTRPA